MSTTKKNIQKKRSSLWLPLLFFTVLICAFAVLYQQENHVHPLLTERAQQQQHAIHDLKNTLASPAVDEHITTTQRQTLINLARIELLIRKNTSHCVSLLKEARSLTQSQAQIEDINAMISSLEDHPYSQRLGLIQTLEKIKQMLSVQTIDKPHKSVDVDHISQQENHSPNLLDALKQKLETAIIIRKTTRTVNPIFEEYDQAAYTQNIKFLLNIGQQGLLEMDNALFHYGINTAHDLLLHQGQLSQQEEEALESLESLQTIDLTLPSIDFSKLNNLDLDQEAYQ